MILKTYQEPNDSNPYIEDLMLCIQKYKLFKYAKYLTDDFELNKNTAPAIDMGRSPYMYKSSKNKNPDEIYHVPTSIYPHFVIVKY